MEIFELKELLDREKIPYDMFGRPGGFQILYPCAHAPRCSLIQYDDDYTSAKPELMEIKGVLIKKDTESCKVSGFVPAKRIFARIKRDYKDIVLKTL